MKATAPSDRDVFLWDDEIRGFGLKTTKAGSRSYIYQYRLGGREAKTKRWTIGTHGSPWTPASARDEAKRLALLVGQGSDPVEAERERRQTAARLGFKDYVATFADLYLKVEWPDTWDEAKRRLEIYAVPVLADRPLPDIARHHVTAVLDKARDKPAVARNLHAVLRKLFNWAVDRGDLVLSPMHKMAAPRAPKARKRVLTPDELVALWRATYSLANPFGPFVRLLICTLQRRNEVACLTWPELHHNEMVWRLPAERAKNNAEHLLPLNELARAEMDAIGWKRKGFVLSTTGTTPISGFSKTKTRLDVAMLIELQGLLDKRAADAGEASEKAVIPRWVFHDIRRTGTTQMQALGIPIEVTERVINHLSGETGGIRGVYNLYDYLPEKRAALDAWGGHLSKLLDTTSIQPD